MSSTSTRPKPPDEDSSDLSAFTTTSDIYAHELYSNVVGGSDIQDFLEESDTYDTTLKKWSTPEAPTQAEVLVHSVHSILSSIVRRFVKVAEAGVKRVLHNTSGSPDFEAVDENGYRACPPLVIQAAGPSFQVPKAPVTDSGVPSGPIEYSQMATFISVKLDSEAKSAEELVDEVTTYARHILLSQPNRSYVRCLVVTENHARLIHFDRAWAEVSPPIDIHQHPSTLIRLVAGLSSTNERLLGIDTSIQWRPTCGGPYEGVLTTTGPGGEPKTYPILERLPTPRDSISGRATTCWRVQDPDTLEELIVKDSWRPDHRPGEYELLEMVKGIPGVVQMVSYETGRGQTKDFRCPTTAGRYQNRVATRVVLKSYGPSVEHFSSTLQMLCAIRDAIAGHRELTSDEIRILHRDVSVHNVLLGKDGAPEGERGVLIDLDLAFRATDDVPDVEIDCDIGIRVFQSLSMLGFLPGRAKPPKHDYLDDLESFFYLLAYLFLLYRPDGSCWSSADEGPSHLLAWSNEDIDKAWLSKNRLFGTGQVNSGTARLVHSAWGSACGDLFETYRDWVDDMEDEKRILRHRPNGVATLLSQREAHYCQVLALFDEAIDSVRESSAMDSTVVPSHAAETKHLVSTGKAGSSADHLLRSDGLHSSVASALPLVAHPTACTAPDGVKAPPEAHSTEVSQPVSSLPLLTRSAVPLRRSACISELPDPKTPPGPSPCMPTISCLNQGVRTPGATQPRRSGRVQKRRLEGDRFLGLPPFKTRRTDNRSNVPTARIR